MKHTIPKHVLDYTKRNAKKVPVIPVLYPRWEFLVLEDQNQASRVLSLGKNGAAKASYKNRQHRKQTLYLNSD